MSNAHIGELLRELTLPKPFSVNAMRTDRHKTARAYAIWQDAARQEIMAQGPRILVEPPVMIEIIFPAAACSPQCDTDNQAKCILDALVSMKILPDDNRVIVPVLLLRWGPSHQTTVRIHEFLGEMF